MRKTRKARWAVTVRGAVVFTCAIRQVAEVFAAGFNAGAEIEGLNVRAVVRRVKGGGR